MVERESFGLTRDLLRPVQAPVRGSATTTLRLLASTCHCLSARMIPFMRSLCPSSHPHRSSRIVYHDQVNNYQSSRFEARDQGAPNRSNYEHSSKNAPSRRPPYGRSPQRRSGERLDSVQAAGSLPRWLARSVCVTSQPMTARLIAYLRKTDAKRSRAV